MGGILGVVGSLVGGLLGRRSEKRAARNAERQAMISAEMQSAFRDQDRRRFEADRSYERRYAAERTTNDRRYAANLLASDRIYRDKMQAQANALAEKSAASRGIDFTRLRDDAVRAGYNPMTAMGMAHAYSTEVGYQQLSGPNGTGGGGGASHVPAGGGISAGGAGYSHDYQAPAMASGSFIADAFTKIADGFFNTPPKTDPLADALRGALAKDAIAQEARQTDISRKFGYDLTDQRPFQPAVTVGVPPMRKEQDVALRPPKMPTGESNIGGRKFIPVQLPNGKFGNLNSSIARRLDIQPFDNLSAGDWSEIVGEVGELESAVYQNGIRKNAIDEPLIAPYVTDYFKRGVTGTRHLSVPPNPTAYERWGND